MGESGGDQGTGVPFPGTPRGPLKNSPLAPSLLNHGAVFRMATGGAFIAENRPIVGNSQKFTPRA